MSSRPTPALCLSGLALLFALRSAHALDGGFDDASTAPAPTTLARMDASLPSDASDASVDASDPTLRAARCSRGDAGVVRAFFQIQREVVLECPRDFRECSGEIEVRVEHCGAGVARLHSVALLNANAAGYGTYPVLVAPGESRAMILRFHGAGIGPSAVVFARLTHADGSETLSSMPVNFRNPARDRARRECRACRGEWGRHGMMGVEGCLCRARDAGRRCTDGRDCQGICLQTGSERVVTRRCRTPICIEEIGLRAVGRCSEFVAQFGCYSYIPEGARDRPPAAGLEVHSACAD